MITEKQQQKLDEIMDEFNFGEVAKVMEFLNWTWASVGGVPCETEIREQARRRLKELIQENNGKPNKRGNWQKAFFSGGIYARHFGGTDDKGPWENLDLKFVLANHTTEENE
jgi:hypothetical protein